MLDQGRNRGQCSCVVSSMFDPIFQLMRWNLFRKVFHPEHLPHQVASEAAWHLLVQVGIIPVKQTGIKHIG
jgi:hypothetical protein